MTQGGSFGGSSCSSSRNLTLTKILQACAFQIWRRSPACGHSQCIYVIGEICAFKSAGCIFVLLYITLRSLYHCRLFTFIGANLSFGSSCACLLVSVPVSFAVPFLIPGQSGGDSLLPEIPCTQPSLGGTLKLLLFPAVLFIPLQGY